MPGADASAWIKKAIGDLDVVKRTLVADPDQNIEAAAYHAQQAAEKAIKALLVGLRLRGAVASATTIEMRGSR